MSPNNKISYRLIAVLEITKNGKTEINKYDKTIYIRFLKKFEPKPFYDEDSGRFYASSSGNQFLFELETTKVKLFLSPRLAQAKSFLRTTHYRYDWIQLLVDGKGKPAKVLNKEEIQNTWELMKSKLTKINVGDAVQRYLKKLDKSIYIDKPLLPAISQYLYYGLAFPNIPIKHHKEWTGLRIIEFSEREEDQFHETITYTGTHADVHTYKIEGRARKNTEINLVKFDGIVERKDMKLLPESAKVEIEYTKEKETSKWSFELYKVLL